MATCTCGRWLNARGTFNSSTRGILQMSNGGIKVRAVR